MPFYEWREPVLALAAEHGCLDEDVNTGDPIVCQGCAASPAPYLVRWWEQAST